jgi:hypothetical protein
METNVLLELALTAYWHLDEYGCSGFHDLMGDKPQDCSCFRCTYESWIATASPQREDGDFARAEFVWFWFADGRSSARIDSRHIDSLGVEDKQLALDWGNASSLADEALNNVPLSAEELEELSQLLRGPPQSN